jgi:DNA-binding NtrC family response regulator
MTFLNQREQRKKVWIIDDEVDMCLLLKTYFLRKNFLVYISHTVADAFSRMGAEKPDFVLLDGSQCKDPERTKAEIEQLIPGVKVIITGTGRSFKLIDYF